MHDVEQILHELRAEGAVLAANGAAFSPDRVERACRDLETALAEYLTWLPEEKAVGRGHPRAALVRRFPSLERQGYARRNPQNLRERQYRGCVVPPDTTEDVLRDSARDAARAAVLGAMDGRRA